MKTTAINTITMVTLGGAFLLFTRPIHAQQQDVFQRSDRNNSGVIEPFEFPGDQTQFDQLDTNKDGILDRKELRSIIEKVSSHQQQIDTDLQNNQTGPGGSGGPEGGKPQGGMGKGGNRKGFEQDDTNNDGRVSRDEFSGPEDLFDKLDRNSDGYITKDEVKSMEEKPANRPSNRY